MRVEDKAALKRYEDIRAKPGGIGIARIEGNYLRRVPHDTVLNADQDRQGRDADADLRKLRPALLDAHDCD